jgi:hypothetical protein
MGGGSIFGQMEMVCRILDNAISRLHPLKKTKRLQGLSNHNNRCCPSPPVASDLNEKIQISFKLNSHDGSAEDAIRRVLDPQASKEQRTDELFFRS